MPKKKPKPKRKRQKVVSYTVPIDDSLSVTLYTIARAHKPVNRTDITKEHITKKLIYAAIRELRTEFFPYAYHFDLREKLKANSGRKRKEFNVVVSELIDSDKLIVHKEQRARGRPLTCYAIPGELGL